MLGLGPHPQSVSSDGKYVYETEEGCHLGIHSSQPLQLQDSLTQLYPPPLK